MVGIPVRNWYLRGGAYVPELAVSSNEVSGFHDFEKEAYSQPSYPFRIARRMKGPYGVIVKFTQDESTVEQAALMDFRFDCMTRLIPCKDESEILAEGSKLLHEPN